MGNATVETSAELLIDRYLPKYDVTLVVHQVVDADVATTWQALCDLDLAEVHTPLLDAAFFVRDLPSRWAEFRGREPKDKPPLPELKLGGDAPSLEGWLGLGRTPQREIAFAAVGKFWQSDITWYDVEQMTPEEFAAFNEPGWGRIAADFTLLPYGATRTLVSYEARTATNDPGSAAKLKRYWSLVQPFVGHIMRAALRSVKQDAETARTVTRV